MKSRVVILTVLGLIIAAVIFVYLFQKEEEPALPQVNAVAPNFSLIAVTGERIELKEVYKENNLTVVNFWATWCPPCRAEIPEFIEVYREYKDRGVEILAVNLGEDADSVRDFVRSYGMTFPVLLDPEGKTGEAYMIRAIPTTFFIDKRGVIRWIQTGTMSYKQLKSLVDRFGQ